MSEPIWIEVCRLDQLELERGAAALVSGRAVALFRISEDEVLALGNHDPFSHASVLSRGSRQPQYSSWRRSGKSTSRPPGVWSSSWS